MKTLKDILIVLLLAILVSLTWVQELDLTSLKHRAFMAEGGLVSLAGGLVSLQGGLVSLESGLVSPKGGSGLQHFRAASAHLFVTESDNQHPIIRGIESDNNDLGPITIIKRIRGTGVFVSDNVLLTAKHIVEDRVGLSGVKVFANGQTYTAVEILEDIDDDLAVVIIAGRAGPYLELGPRPSLGDNLICIGSPISNPIQLIISWGRVSSEKWLNNFIYDGFAAHGCSGGAVIANGKVVGITEALLSKSLIPLGFATPTDRLDPDLLLRLK